MCVHYKSPRTFFIEMSNITIEMGILQELDQP